MCCVICWVVFFVFCVDVVCDMPLFCIVVCVVACVWCCVCVLLLYVIYTIYDCLVWFVRVPGLVFVCFVLFFLLS